MWTTNNGVGDMVWRTMSMSSTPYAYGVDDTYVVENILYVVE